MNFRNNENYKKDIVKRCFDKILLLSSVLSLILDIEEKILETTLESKLDHQLNNSNIKFVSEFTIISKFNNNVFKSLSNIINVSIYDYIDQCYFLVIITELEFIRNLHP
jgi:hypothetical protein